MPRERAPSSDVSGLCNKRSDGCTKGRAGWRLSVLTAAWPEEPISAFVPRCGVPVQWSSRTPIAVHFCGFSVVTLTSYSVLKSPS